MKSLSIFACVIICLALVIVPQVGVQAATPIACTGTPGAPTQYQYQTVLASPCAFSNLAPTDLCVASGASIESVLNNYATSGYELLSMTTSVNYESDGNSTGAVVYLLRIPVTSQPK